MIIENLTFHQHMQILNILQETHTMGDIEVEFRVREKANDYVEDVEVWVKEEKE